MSRGEGSSQLKQREEEKKEEERREGRREEEIPKEKEAVQKGAEMG